MQQHMLTTTDLISRSLETLDKNHTSLQIPTDIIVPTRNWGHWSPQPHPAPVSLVGRHWHQWKHQGRWQRWHLCTSWCCLGMVERSYGANMVLSGSPLLKAQWSQPLLQVMAVLRRSSPNGQGWAQPAQPAGSTFLCSETEVVWSLCLHHLWDIRGCLGTTFKYATSLGWICALLSHLTV